jgi:hypothetical protein
VTDYLLVECIITNLTQGGIISFPESWKNTVIGTRFYYADFFRAGTGSILSFRVSVIEKNHVISTTAFINHAKFLGIDPTEILQGCKITI